MNDSEKLLKLLKIVSEGETEIRDLCKQVLPADVVDGDSYGVPSIVDLVGMLVRLLKGGG